MQNRSGGTSPTSILKSCSDVFSLLITRLATLSFHEGSFPDSYKTASVTPLLKKKDSDRDDPANFRPISNLHTISKLLERLVLSRIMPHVENSPNFNRFQSAYRRGYSTESAILRMLNDVYCAADRKRRSMIVLLDLSAAFDTIDIDTLLRRLEHTFGITGSALLWMKTYLEDRTQFVRIGDDRSGSVHCRFGVPQGSVLGPALFSTYVAPIAGVISSFGVHHTQYADDTQLYIELRDNAVTSLDNCFRAVHQWFIENGLALNPGKSEVIVTGTGARIRQEGRIEEMTLGDTPISVSNTVKSLGVTIDETLSFNNHVDNVCKASFFHIKALRHIRRCIDEDTARTVAGSIVGSRIDYCNSILHGTSASNLNKIQRVINTLARVVTGTGRREHITPVLKRLHWLPVRSRITFKVALMAYKTLTTKKPDYLSELLTFQSAPRTLRSSSSFRLHVDVPKTAFAGRAFRYAAPLIWNGLPNYLTDLSMSLDNFKGQLKTYLFNQCYRH